MKEFFFQTFFYLLSFHWWIFAAVLSVLFIPLYRDPKEHFFDDGEHFGMLAVIVGVPTYSVAFLFETYVLKDTFHWLPAAAVVAIMIGVLGNVVKAIWGKKNPNTDGTGEKSNGRTTVRNRKLTKDHRKKANPPAKVHRERGNKDEGLYEIAWRELEEGIDEGLWARLLAEHDGDEEKTTADYLKTRVERLKSSKLTKVVVPDYDDFRDAIVNAVLVKPGNRVNAETPIIYLESKEAITELPSGVEGKISEVVVKVGDEVSVGSVLALVYKNA